MEILAPVNASTLDAALDAGADAVYFGLKRLNARRGALNFTQDELPEVVEKIHGHGAKAHLALNIDLTQRELGLAIRTLALARATGVDAVIVRDPAILSLRPRFPQLEFHLSTQSGVSSLAGVRMARELGCDRVVLAREMTREEIRACCRVEGIAIEVFVQGALCFCASGRCLLSSWVGGRSGNRGACASPCRVAWRGEDGEAPPAHPLSMKDLCLVERLPELQEMGVASLKIEGRLKSAAWVSQAVRLYAAARAGAQPLPALKEQAEALGGYTGRALTEGYYAGLREGLTDVSLGRGQKAAPASPCAASPAEPPPPAPALLLRVTQDEKGGTCFQCQRGSLVQNLRIPPQRIPNPRRALPLGEILQQARLLLAALPHQLQVTDTLEALPLPRRCQETVLQFLQEFLRRATKEDDGTIRQELPGELQELLRPAAPAPENRFPLGGQAPGVLRLRPGQLKDFLRRPPTPGLSLVLALQGDESPEELEAALAPLPLPPEALTLALPSVCHDDALATLEPLVVWAKTRGHLLEANSWDTLELCRARKAPFATGQGMAILNAMAAAFLQRLGAKWCAASWEMDQKQLQELCAQCPAPLALTLFSRPPLMVTRARLPEAFPPGQILQDARGIRLRHGREGESTVLRPVTPMDWRGLRDARIRAFRWEVDLTGMDSPVPPPPEPSPFLFNFDRTLR
ncbi:MAG: U32 family peptidase [Oligosphaeraceae bacterium]